MSEEEQWEDYTLLYDEVLALYDKLYVMKSISKSYGVPGFRLGILASSNQDMIAEIKRMVSIWNINSYGEFFMQILEKYKKDYAQSLVKIKESRENMIENLKQISCVEVYPSQANYVMCRLKGTEISSKDLSVKLLNEHIFIKDLTSKIEDGNQYIRLAVRTEEENQYLCEKMKEILK